MTSQTDCNPDPAAVFACAFSLWEECRRHAMRDRSLDLSAAYSGWDQLMREVMRIGQKFEQWACDHVKFDDLGEVWPYMLGDRFGSACLEVLSPTELASFEDHECLRVALRLRLPLEPGENLRVPVDVTAQIRWVTLVLRPSVFKQCALQTKITAWLRSRWMTILSPRITVLRFLASMESTKTTSWSISRIETPIGAQWNLLQNSHPEFTFLKIPRLGGIVELLQAINLLEFLNPCSMRKNHRLCNSAERCPDRGKSSSLVVFVSKRLAHSLEKFIVSPSFARTTIWIQLA